MRSIKQIRKNYDLVLIWKLTIASILIGFLSAFLAISLKHITDLYENIFILKAISNKFYFILFPIFGLSIIYFLRYYLFKKKQNKGITEIFDCTASKSKNLPIYKISSHFINGLLTVVFGGSTGIEVSTVVATATIGSVTYQKERFLKKYKTELICVGVTSGITALFCSPLAGILFSMEVISKKRNKIFFLTNIISLLIASGLLNILNEKPLFSIVINHWNLYAIPYFVLLGILAGLNSVYITKCVIFFKSWFSKIETQYYRIIIGGLILGISFLFLPQLYGDGYHAIRGVFNNTIPNLTYQFILTLLGIIILKPVVTSITLASGGDGGVFAPSLFVGAFLGLLLAVILNSFFNLNVVPVNFMVIGMAAVLSASIHAPFTALFLVCGMINDYTLFIPILMVCLISKWSSKLIIPYTVYSYSKVISK